MNEGKHYHIDNLGAVLGGLGVFLLIVFSPSLFFAIKGDQLGFAISITIIAVLFLGVLLIAAFAIGMAYTRSTMRDGAGIALQAQDFNDRWDVAKMGHQTKIFTEGARAARSLQVPTEPLMPLPSQDPSWMPEVALLQDVGDGNGDGWMPE